MQTFLPYPDFARSAEVLDDVRLGKQRVEAYQIVRSLDGVTQGWRNHPVVKMWRSHVEALIDYGLATCLEWTRRGRADTRRRCPCRDDGGHRAFRDPAQGRVTPG